MSPALPSLKVQRPTATLRELAREKMRAAILDTHFQPGERLIERALCEILGVSRTLVCEIQRASEPQDRQTVRVLTCAFYKRMFIGGEKRLVCEVAASLSARINRLRARIIASDHRSRQIIDEVCQILSGVLAGSPAYARRAVIENADRVTEIARELFAEGRESAL